MSERIKSDPMLLIGHFCIYLAKSLVVGETSYLTKLIKNILNLMSYYSHFTTIKIIVSGN